ncbi:MAG: TetR family transcriptional regulator [Chitinivibrionales bacterium]|nr:TetR family transcriptional regulator [Chitinivibrionales bacterium]
MGAQHDIPRGKSRQQILDAALKLFGTKGYHSSSVDTIAGNAGVSKGLVYNYFSSKEDILEAVIFEKMKEIEESFRTGIPAKNPGEMLRRFIETGLEIARSEPEYWRFYWSMILHPALPKTIKNKVMASYGAFIGQFEMLLRMNGVEKPELEARILVPMLDAINIMHVFAPDYYPFEEVKKHLIGKYSANSPEQSEEGDGQ